MEKLLIADDDQRMRRALVRSLSKHYEITEASDAAEAIDKLPAVDLVLTDWDMPAGGGARVVRACQVVRKPVLIHTGNFAVVREYPNSIIKGSSIDDILRKIGEVQS